MNQPNNNINHKQTGLIMNKPAFFQIQSLTFDPDLQIRVKINEETIALYAEQMTTEDDMKAFPAVEIYYDGVKYWLADGHHRRAAAEKAGHDKVWAIVKSGTRSDALWGAILGNGKQGFALTPEDRKRAIMLAIQQWPDKSNRVIAEAIGCSHTTVLRLRPSTGTNVPVEEERRTGKDGRSRPAKPNKPKSAAKQKTTKSPQSQETTGADSEPAPESTKQDATTHTTGSQAGFAPGSPEEEKYSAKTTLTPIPRNRPDVLVRNLLTHFPKEFVPNMIRVTFQILVEIGERDQAKALASEVYKQFGRK
jgi:ParB-like chromosome segregation protein Spo0J